MTLRLSTNMVANANNDSIFPHESLVPERKITIFVRILQIILQLM